MITLLTGKCYSPSLFSRSQLRNIHWASFLVGVHRIFSKEFLVAVATGKRAKQNIVSGLMRVTKASVCNQSLQKSFRKLLEAFRSDSWILTDFLRGAACGLRGYL